MAETTHISWADSTLNIWEGCQETGSPACVGCYARERNLRWAPKGSTVAPNWGPRAPRREVKSWRSTLRKISRLAKAAFAAGRTDPWFVFVNSLSDFFDNQADPFLRAEALDEFDNHPHLTFLLLTKRPQNIVKMMTIPGNCLPRNIALLCTVVTQAEADRDLPHLLIAAAALQPAFVGVSMEPLVEQVDIAWALSSNPLDVAAGILKRGHFSPGLETVRRVDWVIAGGGTDQGKIKAFITPNGAFTDLEIQCEEARVPFHFKQWGSWIPAVPTRVDQMENDPNWRRVGNHWFQHMKPAQAGRTLLGKIHDARPAVRA